LLGNLPNIPKEELALGAAPGSIFGWDLHAGLFVIIHKEHMQIEGFFKYLMSGFFSGSVIHHLVAKLAGPAISNRGWCGWSCWMAMILDLPPFTRNKTGRPTSKWEFLRYVHFDLSLGLVLVLWYGFHYRVHSPIFAPLEWLLIGNLLYYIFGTALAYRLKVNRAFFKYIYPVPVFQKISSRFLILKLEGPAEKCTGYGACYKICKINIQVSQFTQSPQRVLSTECILWNECAHVCAKVPSKPR
jgi:polyferredoxin